MNHLPSAGHGTLCALALILCSAHGAELAKSTTARLLPVPPCAALVAAARTNPIPLEPIQAPGALGWLQIGDSASALVTLNEKNAVRSQWLMYLEVAAPVAGDKIKPKQPIVLYSSLGNRLEYTSAPVVVTLRILGPFADSAPKRRPPKAQEKHARFVLDEGFLSIGLAPAAAGMFRLQQSKIAGHFGFHPAPFLGPEVEQGRKMAEIVRLTPEEERSLGGIFPALTSYFDIVEQTPGLEEIVMRIMDWPSIWSILRHGGVRASFNLVPDQVAHAGEAICDLPGHPPAYLFPIAFKLNEHRALDITLIVTSPRRPLLACGGVIGLLAENPIDSNEYLTLRVLSARHGTHRPASRPQ